MVFYEFFPKKSRVVWDFFIAYLYGMKAGKRSRPLFLFYVLVTYVFIQFGWWTFLLIRLNNEVNVLQETILTLQQQNIKSQTSDFKLQDAEKLLKDKLHKQWAMIFGEGSVFLVLLILGIVRTRNSFKKESALAAQQKNFLLSVTHELKSPLASCYSANLRPCSTCRLHQNRSRVTVPWYSHGRYAHSSLRKKGCHIRLRQSHYQTWWLY